MKSYASSAPAVKSDDHAFHNQGPVTVYANDPQECAAGMAGAMLIFPPRRRITAPKGRDIERHNSNNPNRYLYV